ncbi:hypothetical protein QL285_019824 [Trifolium repens]|nr:hypothetical protein QL285_019824 [Trifolium repens]
MLEHPTQHLDRVLMLEHLIQHLVPACRNFNWNITFSNKFKHILSTKQNNHLFHPTIPVFAIKHWKLGTHTTVSIHLQSLCVHLNLTNTRVSQSRRIRKCDSVTTSFKIQLEFKKRNQSHNASRFTRVSRGFEPEL